ncbi:MAG: thioredoxin [Coriobacteriales bacterium]|nr:thioredoxin [Coriobacteriales bacterium]
MREKRQSIPIALLVLALALLLIVAGILQGDLLSTLGKAIRVCLECIGIG